MKQIYFKLQNIFKDRTIDTDNEFISQFTNEELDCFKIFEINDEIFSYQFKQKRIVKRIQLNNIKLNKLIQHIKGIINHYQRDMKQIASYKKWLETYQNEGLINLKEGSIVYWIEGYNCTLYQFAKVVKITKSSVKYQKFGYRGMNVGGKPHELNLTNDSLTNEFFIRRNHNSITNLYNPNRDYTNNSD